MTRLLVLACVLAAASATAQTKFSGKCSQPKPDPSYAIPVGDRADHVLVLSKVTCTWSAGELSGVAVKAEDDVVVSDVSGNVSRDKGYGVGTLASGDHYYVLFGGRSVVKNGAPTTADCTWSFTGGTGKLKGLTGKGTCRAAFDSSGGAAFEIEGVYELGAAKGAAKPK